MAKDTHHIIEIPEIGLTKYIPKELQYCNSKEFIDMARLLFSWQCGTITFQDLKVQAVYLLMDLKKGKRKLNHLQLNEALGNISLISELIEFFFTTTDDGDKRIKLNIIENPVPEIKPVAKVLKGPKPRLTDTTFGQYEDAAQAYQMYYRSQNTDYLWQLFYIYYQDKSYKKERTEELIKKYKAFTDPAQVFAFFLFFESFQSYVTASKVVIEGKVIDLSILFTTDKNAPKSALPGLGTKSLAFHISKTGITGNLQETRQQPLWEIFLLLYDIRKTEIDEAEEAKRNQNKS